MSVEINPFERVTVQTAPFRLHPPPFVIIRLDRMIQKCPAGHNQRTGSSGQAGR
jgi:hypothetical protein